MPRRRDRFKNQCATSYTPFAPSPCRNRCGLVLAEVRVLGLDHQEELVGRRQAEPLDVEHRVVGLRQPVQRDHADRRRQRREENRQLVGRHDERRPGGQRPAADVERILDRRGPVLEREAGGHAGERRGQHQLRQHRPLLVDDVVQLFDRESACRPRAGCSPPPPPWSKRRRCPGPSRTRPSARRVPLFPCCASMTRIPSGRRRGRRGRAARAPWLRAAACALRTSRSSARSA